VTKRSSREEWLERVRAWKASGKSRAAFVRNKKYSERSLGWWAWKLASEGEDVGAKPKPKPRKRRKAEPLELVELMQPSQGEGGESLTVRVGSLELLVGRGFDRELLGRVLDVLEARS